MSSQAIFELTVLSQHSGIDDDKSICENPYHLCFDPKTPKWAKLSTNYSHTFAHGYISVKITGKGHSKNNKSLD